MAYNGSRDIIHPDSRNSYDRWSKGYLMGIPTAYFNAQTGLWCVRATDNVVVQLLNNLPYNLATTDAQITQLLTASGASA